MGGGGGGGPGAERTNTSATAEDSTASNTIGEYGWCDGRAGGEEIRVCTYMMQAGLREGAAGPADKVGRVYIGRGGGGDGDGRSTLKDGGERESRWPAESLFQELV